MEMADGGRTLLPLLVGKRASRLAGAAEARERTVVRAMVAECMTTVVSDRCCTVEKLEEEDVIDC